MKNLIEIILQKYAGEIIEVLPPEISAEGSICDPQETVIIHNSLNKACDIYLFITPEKLTLVFGNWSYHFQFSEKQIKQFFKTLDLIIHREACVISICNDTFVFSVLCWENQMYFSSDARTRIDTMFSDRKFLMDAAHNAIIKDTLIWEEPDIL